MIAGVKRGVVSKICEEEFKKFCKGKGIEIGQISVDSEQAEKGDGSEISGSDSFSSLTVKLLS